MLTGSEQAERERVKGATTSAFTHEQVRETRFVARSWLVLPVGEARKRTSQTGGWAGIDRDLASPVDPPAGAGAIVRPLQLLTAVGARFQASGAAPLPSGRGRRNQTSTISGYSNRFARCERDDTHQRRSRVRLRSVRARRHGSSGWLRSRPDAGQPLRAKPATGHRAGSTPAGAMGCESRAAMIGPATPARRLRPATAALLSSW